MSTSEEKRRRVVVLGAGAAGLMAAATMRESDVTVIERNEKPGKKLYITGKGRCNVTNACDPGEFLRYVVHNAKFLYSSLYGFPPQSLRDFLDECGVPTKVERGRRVFPVSDKASDVIRGLYERARQNGAKFVFDTRVTDIRVSEEGFAVIAAGETYACDALLIATGGRSYPATGSTGDGYLFAKRLGHTVTETAPSLTAMRTQEDVRDLAGLTLKNVNVRLSADKETYEQFGELLFTHDGVSGPAVLHLSANVCRRKPPFAMHIDLKPARTAEQTDTRLTELFAAHTNKQLRNVLDEVLPKALIPHLLRVADVDGATPCHAVTRAMRGALVQALKAFPLCVTALAPYEEAVITSGGIDVREVDPKTMQSKRVPHLYFAGEILDVDAYTGGYNLQIAFSTAYAAATAIERGEVHV